MALFEKSMDELREAFVRNRFAEGGVFGREDIEEWVGELREAESPDILSCGMLLGDHFHDIEDPTSFVQQYGTRVEPGSVQFGALLTSFSVHDRALAEALLACRALLIADL